MRRRIAIITLLLIGGAIVNIAVAWGVRFLLQEDPTVIVQNTPSSVIRLADADDGATDDLRSGVLIHRVQSCCDDYLRRTNELWAITSARSTKWKTFAKSVRADSWFQPTLDSRGRYRFAEVLVRGEYSAGWPCRSLRYRERYVAHPDLLGVHTTPSRFEDGTRVPMPFDEWRKNLPVPLRPIVPGFFINTLFYALLLWLLFFTPFAARRMIRRKRGRCEKCAYPIGESPACTECGAMVSRRRKAEA